MIRKLHKVLVMLFLALPVTVFAAEDLVQRQGSPLIEPEVERNEIIEAKIDDEDFEVGFYGGLYSTEDFGSNSVLGARFAYHITEDYFIEFAAGETTTEKSSAEELFFVDLIEEGDRVLRYYNVGFGYNILPGETFISSGWAFYTAFYAIAGVGTTQFAGENIFTVNFGFGFRFIATDWMAFHVDVRDHIFELDVIKEDDSTHNLEMHGGITFFF
ncbi:outer membrane beta-barrel domain-containing protein [Kaarinaea lacus]